MRYKSDVCLDILAVLAYGPQPIINSAGQVLLHYYPLKDVGKADNLMINVCLISIAKTSGLGLVLLCSIR